MNLFLQVGIVWKRFSIVVAGLGVEPAPGPYNLHLDFVKPAVLALRNWIAQDIIGACQRLDLFNVVRRRVKVSEVPASGLRSDLTQGRNAFLAFRLETDKVRIFLGIDCEDRDTGGGEVAAQLLVGAPQIGAAELQSFPPVRDRSDGGRSNTE
jgi:hypothetical protein